MDIYSWSIVGLVAAALIPLVLAGMVGPAKGKAQGIGGPVQDARDENPVFRLDRAHGNAVESVPPFLGLAVLAMLAGIGAGILALLVWAFAAVRVLHAVVYIRGGTPARGGNLRTFVYLAGLLLSLVLAVLTVIAALS